MANKYIKTGTIKPCLVCHKDIYIEPNLKNRKKFCSKKCFFIGRVLKGTYQKGHPKSFLGKRIHTQKTKDKISLNSKGKHCGELAWN